MNGNDFMSWILRSPFHGILSNGMVLITVTGRKTGKAYTTPVGYYVDGDSLWILTSRERKWWRNLQNGAEVSLLLKRKLVAGISDVELDEKSVGARMVDYLRHIPQAAKPMGVRMENKQPNVDDLSNIAKGRLFIRVRLLG
jgi:deazaflavin-dependent oxidoreductase (nitroreductase family)